MILIITLNCNDFVSTTLIIRHVRKSGKICITLLSHQLYYNCIIDVKSSFYSHHFHTPILTSVEVIESDAV